MKLCGCQDTCPMRLYSKFQLPGWSGTLQAGQRVIFKNLPCKSPRFLAFFQRLCFYGYLEAFSGKVQESRPCLTFNFTYWDMFFDLKKASGGCQEASESWHVLNFLSFWLHQTTQTQCLTTIRLLRAWKLFNNEYISYKKSWMVSWGHGPGVRWEQGHGGVHPDHGEHAQIHVCVVPFSKCQHPGMSNVSYRKPRAGGQWQQGHGGVHQNHGEHDQTHVLHLFQNASIQS